MLMLYQVDLMESPLCYGTLWITGGQLLNSSGKTLTLLTSFCVWKQTDGKHIAKLFVPKGLQYEVLVTAHGNVTGVLLGS